MGSHPLCTRIPLREATGERVRALLGSPNRYYAQRPPRNPARWRELLGRSRPGAGFGEAREPHDWEELRVGERARALSVEPGAVRWADRRGYAKIGGAAHDYLYCRDDSGDDVRSGAITLEADDKLFIEGTQRD